MKDFKNLRVWQKAHELTLAVYKASSEFPNSEVYGLTSQLRRSAASIAANIAEGYGRGGDKELARFIQISLGSASELEYHLLLAKDLSYLNVNGYDILFEETMDVQKMLTGFLHKLQASS